MSRERKGKIGITTVGAGAILRHSNHGTEKARKGNSGDRWCYIAFGRIWDKEELGCLGKDERYDNACFFFSCPWPMLALAA
jgi:hypothetical protein